MIIPGLYEVSNKEGRIRSLNYRGLGRTEVLKPRKVRGYYMVTLTKDGKTQCFYVHRLVATMFIPNPENKPFVNHKDENKLNNSVENLEWCTNKENLNYGTAQQRRSEVLKGKHLSEEHKHKISEAKRGKPKSEEHKKKLSEATKGKKKKKKKIKNECIKH